MAQTCQTLEFELLITGKPSFKQHRDICDVKLSEEKAALTQASVIWVWTGLVRNTCAPNANMSLGGPSSFTHRPVDVYFYMAKYTYARRRMVLVHRNVLCCSNHVVNQTAGGGQEEWQENGRNYGNNWGTVTMLERKASGKERMGIEQKKS